jgi:hypothetical protein
MCPGSHGGSPAAWDVISQGYGRTIIEDKAMTITARANTQENNRTLKKIF